MPCSHLFEPLRVGTLVLLNRLVIGPMCQYSADNGCMTDWHLIHLGHLALSGAGLLFIEVTAVLSEGRISPGDVGLWNEETASAMSLTIESIRRWSDVPIAIELSHAGRRGSVEAPWNGGMPIDGGSGRGWQRQAPSSLPYLSGSGAPRALDRTDLRQIREAFANAAVRATQAGVDSIQIHSAEGFLLHQFLSPRSNQRGDSYGGSLQNRMRFPLEVFDTVRDAVPSHYPVTVRLPAFDGAGNGWGIEQAVTFAAQLQSRGCDAFHVTAGGLQPESPPEMRKEMVVVRAVKRAVTVPVIVTSLDPNYARVDAVVANGHVDAVALTRTILQSPRWPWNAARLLHASVETPVQYQHV